METEYKIKKDDYILFFPFGKNGDSAEMVVRKRVGHKLWAVLSSQGIRDADYFGWLYELSDEITMDVEDVVCIKKNKKNEFAII